MTRPRVIATVVVAMAIGMAILPAQATDPTIVEESCLSGARLADSTSCTVQATASTDSGAVSAHTRLVSPEGGTVPWLAEANSVGLVTASFNTAGGLQELNFEIAVRVNQATVSIAPNLSGVAGWYVSKADRGRAAHANVTAAALHSSCSACVGGTTQIVLSAERPGTTLTDSDRDFVLHVKMTNQGGADIPAGTVTVRAGVGAPVWQTNAWGDDSATIDAVVGTISLV